MTAHAAVCPPYGLMPPAIPPSPGARTPDALDACGAAAFLVVAALSWTALTLAEFGVFSRVAFFGAAALVLAGLGVWLRPMGAWMRRRPETRSAAWLALLLLASAPMLRRPPDPSVGGADESIYFHLASIVETRGGFVVPDPLLEATPPAEWPSLFSRDGNWPRLLNRFEGGVQVQDGVARLRPNFFHLTPAWIAAVETIAGPAGAVRAVPLLAWLVPAILFLLARQLVSVPAAIAASLLLALNPGHLWIGRLPLSEPPAAFLIITGLAFATLWLSSGERAAGALAGLSFGLAALDRIDALLLVVPVIVVFLIVEQHRARIRVSAVVWPLAILTLQCLAHALTISKPYTERLVRFVAHDRHISSTLVVVAALALTAAIALAARRMRWRPSTEALSQAGAALVVVLVGWLAVRVGSGASTNHLTVLLTGPGVVLAVAGVILASQSSDRGVWLAIAVVALSAVMFAEAPRELRAFPRIFRRDVPLLLPLMTLFQAYALFPAWAGRAHRFLAATLLVALAGVQGHRALTIYHGGTEAMGARQAVEAIAGLLPADTVVIADSLEADHLDLALDARGGRQTAGPRRTGDSGPALRALADRTLAVNRPVVFLTTAGDQPLRIAALAGLSFTPAGRASFLVDRAGTRWPAPADARRVDVAIYRLASRASLPWHRVLGIDDFGSILAGWHAPETLMRERGRWTLRTATIHVPAFACDAGARPSDGAIRFASIRPASVRQPRVTVSIGRQEVLQVTPQDSGFHVYPFRLSDGSVHDLCDSPAIVNIFSDAFVPERDAGLRDGRELGIAVAWFELNSSTSVSPHE
jgi:hypothetical protein